MKRPWVTRSALALLPTPWEAGGAWKLQLPASLFLVLERWLSRTDLARQMFLDDNSWKLQPAQLSGEGGSKNVGVVSGPMDYPRDMQKHLLEPLSTPMGCTETFP